AMKVGGANAVYYVVPVLGALSVWLTYILGRRIAGPQAGVAAAILVAFSPIFVFHTIEPMSDVPATAWWLLAWACATAPTLGGPVWSAFFAGLAVSLAIATRPNLAPLALILVWVV